MRRLHGHRKWILLIVIAIILLWIIQGIAQFSTDPLLPIYKNGKWGYADRMGKIVIEPQFDDANEFSEGLAAVGFENLNKPTLLHPDYIYGVIDKSGALVIKPKYYEAGKFSEGLTAVNIEGESILEEDQRWGYIDRTGKVILEFQYKKAGNFSEGMAPVKIGKKYGYIDKGGTIVIQAQFEYAGEFIDGVAYASVGKTTYTGKGSIVEIHFQGKTGYIDKTGVFFNEVFSQYSK